MKRASERTSREGAGGTSASSVDQLRRIIAARARVEEANTELRLAVKAARDAGESWAMIGATLDTSRRSRPAGVATSFRRP
jgi:hypothetical protein